MNLGNALAALGGRESGTARLEARAAYGDALGLFKQVDDRLGQAHGFAGLGDLERKLGHNDQARAAYDEAITLFKQVDDRLGQANVLRGLGDLESTLGRNEQARAAYDEAITLQAGR